jgi:hypothetical protein
MRGGWRTTGDLETRLLQITRNDALLHPWDKPLSIGGGRDDHREGE